MPPSRRAVSLALALAIVAIAAPAAQAANVTTVSRGSDAVLVRQAQEENGTVASGGLENVITVSEAPDGGLQIRDSGRNASVVAQAPCTLLTADTVVCPAFPGNNARVEVTPGAGDDLVTINLAERNRTGVVRSEVYGGLGNDQLTGGDIPDVIEGDGRTGSGAALPADSSDVTTGTYDDHIQGRGGADVIRGGPGRDYLNGGVERQTTADGNNTIDGGPGSDFLDAGSTLGADRFTGGTNAAILTGARRTLALRLFENNLVNGVPADVGGGDVVSYGTRTYTSGGTTGVTADADGEADDGTTGANEGDRIDSDVESIGGTIRNDTITGTSASNNLIGFAGVDTLKGGSGGSDYFQLRDGIGDTCVPAGADDVVDADLVDPLPEECTPSTVLFQIVTFTFNFKPADETIPYVGVGVLKRTRSGRLQVKITCAKESKKTCTGDVRLQGAKGGKSLVTKRFKAKRGRTTTVTLSPAAARLAALRQAGAARLLAVSQGTSKKGPTTTQVQRRVN